MDTLHFDPPRAGTRASPHQPEQRTDGLDPGEVEAYMLRGRQLQAQAVAEGMRRAVTALRSLLRGGSADHVRG